MDLYTGLPFFRARDGVPDGYPALQQSLDVDVVVMGAGITGALVAHELTRAGAAVVVLDRDAVASGSTAATSGLLLYDTDASLAQIATRVGVAAAGRTYRLGLQAISRIERMCAAWPDHCGFARRPSMYLASTPEDVPDLRDEYERRCALGLDVHFMDREDIDARYSFSASAAIQSRGSAEIDCYGFARRVLTTACAAGARIFERTPVTAIRPRRGKVELDIAGGHLIRASRVVCATGYEAAAHLRRKTGNLASTWVIVSQPLAGFDGWDDRCLIWETSRPYLYIRSTDDGRLLAGGEDEPWSERHQDPALLREKSERLLKRVRAMFPHLGIALAGAWAGTFATTDDGLPFIGETDECPGVWFALGYGGNGITFSMVAAEILRDAYLGHPHADARLFSFERTRTIAAAAPHGAPSRIS